eukprot:TRINITY_DN1486_c0_g1_i2.p1 TRINITY_DN1486_c0_g1~~TRINITY_DN1486_c0_g1_i2.p1  ORF type:complete len:263 (-),score=-25.58 TRINITY_DN1486_c0_g1_i2:485-1273(-)
MQQRQQKYQGLIRTTCCQTVAQLRLILFHYLQVDLHLWRYKQSGLLIFNFFNTLFLRKASPIATPPSTSILVSSMNIYVQSLQRLRLASVGCFSKAAAIATAALPPILLEPILQSNLPTQYQFGERSIFLQCVGNRLCPFVRNLVILYGVKSIAFTHIQCGKSLRMLQHIGDDFCNLVFNSIPPYELAKKELTDVQCSEWSAAQQGLQEIVRRCFIFYIFQAGISVRVTHLDALYLGTLTYEIAYCVDHLLILAVRVYNLNI